MSQSPSDNTGRVRVFEKLSPGMVGAFAPVVLARRRGGINIYRELARKTDDELKAIWAVVLGLRQKELTIPEAAAFAKKAGIKTEEVVLLTENFKDRLSESPANSIETDPNKRSEHWGNFDQFVRRFHHIWQLLEELPENYASLTAEPQNSSVWEQMSGIFSRSSEPSPQNIETNLFHKKEKVRLRAMRLLCKMANGQSKEISFRALTGNHLWGPAEFGWLLLAYLVSGGVDNEQNVEAIVDEFLAWYKNSRVFSDFAEEFEGSISYRRLYWRLVYEDKEKRYTLLKETIYKLGKQGLCEL